MQIQENIDLKDYLTMKLGGAASYFIIVKSIEEVQSALKFATDNSFPYFIIGGGSNIVATDEPYDGVIIHPVIMGFEITNDTPEDSTIKIGAGETWDYVVERAVILGLQGIEAMSAIPGLAGAAPVQNVGAYGQEIADTFISLEAIDTTTGYPVTLHKQDCGFGYRHSIFRGEQAGRYIITSITIKLKKASPQPPFYKALQAYLDERSITDYSLSSIRKAVTTVRARKLPDPAKQPNTGSFFKNSLVPKAKRDQLVLTYPDMPSYDMPNDVAKIPTGWLIEQTGLKGRSIEGMQVNPDNALVLINQSATSYSQLAAARDHIIQAVWQKFAIKIEQEPLELNNI